MKYRIIPFVDHEIGYRLLRKLISKKWSNIIEIPAVVTTESNKNSWWPSVMELCKTANLPLLFCDQSALEVCKYTNVDYFLLLSWKYILLKPLLAKPKKGVVNLHYSLLPKYRGSSPINRPIINGETQTGVTYHFPDEGVDKGYLICQEKAPIFLDDTARTLQLRLDDVAYDLFDEMLDLIFNKPRREFNISLADKNIINYQSRADFIKSNELDLNHEYRTIDLLNLLRGKTFLPDSNNLYVIDPITKKRLYITVQLSSDK